MKRNIQTRINDFSIRRSLYFDAAKITLDSIEYTEKYGDDNLEMATDEQMDFFSALSNYFGDRQYLSMKDQIAIFFGYKKDEA